MCILVSDSRTIGVFVVIIDNKRTDSAQTRIVDGRPFLADLYSLILTSSCHDLYIF